MTAKVATNEESIAEAERNYRRLNAWFILFLLLIPLGVILPCVISAIAYRIAGDEVSAPIALSALLWPIVGIAGSLLLRGGRKRARRSRDLARLADSFLLSFTRRPPSESYAFLKLTSIFADSHVQSGENQMEGVSGRRPMIALDYHYSFHWGSVTEYADQTIAVFLSGFDHLPAFAVFPIGTMGRIENFFLGKVSGAIPFPQHPQFNSQFAVVGEDPQAITGCLSPRVVDMLLSDRLLSLVVEGGRLLVFRRLTIVKAEDYQAFLAQSFRVAELLAERSGGPPFKG
jgi:hypothetical protein